MFRQKWFALALLFALLGNLVLFHSPGEAGFTERPRPLGSLEPGAIVVDPASVWEFKKGDNYSGDPFKTEPVEWIVVKHDHFGAGTTLLISKELVARHFYAPSGAPSVWETSQIRGWLRTTFFNHLSQNFQLSIAAATTTTGGAALPGETVFLLSQTELGLAGSDGAHVEYFAHTGIR